MYQTGYKGVTTLSAGLPFNGGFCKWWYAKREDILAWPAIDPLTQFLSAEPSLKPGCTWYGPVKVPDGSLGFEEPTKRSGAGIYYQQKVSGFHPGDDAFSRNNIANMQYHEFVVVGLKRAGGFFLVLGHKDKGFLFNHDYSSGKGRKSTAGSDIAFTLQSINNGLVLESFSMSPATPPPSYFTATGTVVGDANASEIIPFTDADATVDIIWNSVRRAAFGDMPLIEVWQINPGGDATLFNTTISVDAAPPANTSFTVYLPGIAGFVVIK